MEPLTEHAVSHWRHSGVFSRRNFLKLGGLAGLSWLTPVGQLLARAAEAPGRKQPAQSIILLWLGGGPSQLETFDPHPDTDSDADDLPHTDAPANGYADAHDHTHRNRNAASRAWRHTHLSAAGAPGVSCTAANPDADRDGHVGAEPGDLRPCDV